MAKKKANNKKSGKKKKVAVRTRGAKDSVSSGTSKSTGKATVVKRELFFQFRHKNKPSKGGGITVCYNHENHRLGLSICNGTDQFERAEGRRWARRRTTDACASTVSTLSEEQIEFIRQNLNEGKIKKVENWLRAHRAQFRRNAIMFAHQLDPRTKSKDQITYAAVQMAKKADHVLKKGIF